MVYRYTKNKSFLDAAVKTANLYISKMPKDIYIPKWDFNAPGDVSDVRIQDSSAAVIVASALIELIQYLPKTHANYKKYVDFIKKTYSYLFNNKSRYLDVNNSLAAYLQHGTAFFNGGRKDIGLIYGDYYLTEGLNRFMKNKRLFD